jgi:Zn-dependent peptidase ImmA (M78 family)/DNA-binding XRE family transcriptional regulator
LTALRNLFGITQEDLARRLGVTQGFLSQIERGARGLPDAMLVRASEEFSLPTAFFAVVEAEADRGPVTFRKSAAASARDEHRVVEFYGEAARLFRDVSGGSGYRTTDLPDPAEYDDDPDLVAEAMRSAAGLGVDEPVRNAVRAVERLGIGVVDNLDVLDGDSAGHVAVSRPSWQTDRPLVALVAQVPGAVKRLTVLHEVGHLIFDRNLAAPIASTRSPEEKRAYRFAGAYLLPNCVVRARVSETLTLHGYLRIKADYGMSVGAIIIRARDLRVISAQRARSLQIQLSAQGWRTAEPVPVPDERPLLLGQALTRAYGQRAVAKAAHSIGLQPEWITRWTHTDTPCEEPRPAPSNVVDFAAARAKRIR